MKPDSKIQAHGMTHDEMADLQYKQEHGEVEFVDANNAGDNIKDVYFKKLYFDHQIPAHEQHIYHVANEARTWSSDGANPIKTSNSSVAKFTREAWEFQKKANAFAGKVIHILHNPELNEAKGKKAKEAIKEEKVPGAVQINEAVTGQPDGPNVNTTGAQPTQNQQLESIDQGTVDTSQLPAANQTAEQAGQGQHEENLDDLTVAELKEYYTELSGETAPSAILKADLIKEIKRLKKQKGK